MTLAHEIVYRDLDQSPSLNDTIGRKMEKLARLSDKIQHGRVVLDTPHNHKHKGKMYRASIELGINGNSVSITRDDASIHIAIREAFNTAERKPKERSERMIADRHY